MNLPELPQSVDVSAEAKRAIIGGVRKAIESYQAVGAIDTAASYQDFIHDVDHLIAFINAVRADPKPLMGVAVDKDGGPVTDENTTLVCGVTLAQVSQLLVKTCARHVLDQILSDGEKTVTEFRTRRKFLFFKVKEKVTRRRVGGSEERKLREIMRYVAFEWQLPLLGGYAKLNLGQLMEIDIDLLALNSIDTIEQIAAIDQVTIKKAKLTAGDEFTDIISKRPRALEGVAQWNKEMFNFYCQVLGERAIDFFARDNTFFMVCAGLDRPLIKIYGPMLASIAGENLEEMQRLNIDKVDILMEAMKMSFGDKCAEVLSQPAFSKTILRRLVESLLHVNKEKAQLAISAQLTCKAIAPQVMEWLARQPSLPA